MKCGSAIMPPATVIFLGLKVNIRIDKSELILLQRQTQIPAC